MPSPERVAAVLLAAGASRRFGAQDKLMAPLAGRPLVSHAANTLAAMGFGRRLAVCAQRDDPVATLLSRQGFEIVPGALPGEGFARSLANGVAAAARYDIDAILICLADMPFVPMAHFAALLQLHDGGVKSIVASAHADIAMPPALFGTALFPELEALEGDAGARRLLAHALIVPAAHAFLRDVDTPDDLLPMPGSPPSPPLA